MRIVASRIAGLREVRGTGVSFEGLYYKVPENNFQFLLPRILIFS